MSLSRDELHQAALLANSYTRLPNLIDCYRTCDRDDCLRVLGDIWTVCDNIGEHKADLRCILPRSAEPLMMTPEELAELEALPDPLTVSRGADRGVNERGLSWSLDRDVAARFPFLNRYGARNPVLVTASVGKRSVTALKNCREERELIILSGVSVLRVEPLV